MTANRPCPNCRRKSLKRHGRYNYTCTYCGDTTSLTTQTSSEGSEDT